MILLISELTIHSSRTIRLHPNRSMHYWSGGGTITSRLSRRETSSSIGREHERRTSRSSWCCARTRQVVLGWACFGFAFMLANTTCCIMLSASSRQTASAPIAPPPTPHTSLFAHLGRRCLMRVSALSHGLGQRKVQIVRTHS